MLVFMVNSNQLHDLVEAISVLTETFDDTFDLKFSQSRFSIMAATSPSSRCILALQLSPSFFDVYACNKLEYKLVYIQNFYHTKFNLQRNGFTELGFACFDSDQEPGYQARNDIRMLLDIDEDGYLDRNAVRIFANPEAGTYERNDLPFCASTDRMDDTFEFDCANFVSIESQEFINIITRFSNFDNVLVTLSSSQVKFSYGSTQIFLTKEENQCIIGGIGESDQIIFAITLQPTELFSNFVSRSKRVWLFKSNNSLKGVIAAPLGLYARYVAYFPYRR